MLQNPLGTAEAQMSSVPRSLCCCSLHYMEKDVLRSYCSSWIVWLRLVWMIPWTFFPYSKALKYKCYLFQDLLKQIQHRSERVTESSLCPSCSQSIKKKKKHFRESIFVLECWIINTLIDFSLVTLLFSSSKTFPILVCKKETLKSWVQEDGWSASAELIILLAVWIQRVFSVKKLPLARPSHLVLADKQQLISEW